MAWRVASDGRDESMNNVCISARLFVFVFFRPVSSWCFFFLRLSLFALRCPGRLGRTAYFLLGAKISNTRHEGWMWGLTGNDKRNEKNKWLRHSRAFPSRSETGVSFKNPPQQLRSSGGSPAGPTRNCRHPNVRVHVALVHLNLLFRSSYLPLRFESYTSVQ